MLQISSVCVSNITELFNIYGNYSEMQKGDIFWPQFCVWIVSKCTVPYFKFNSEHSHKLIHGFWTQYRYFLLTCLILFNNNTLMMLWWLMKGCMGQPLCNAVVWNAELVHVDKSWNLVEIHFTTLLPRDTMLSSCLVWKRVTFFGQ